MTFRFSHNGTAPVPVSKILVAVWFLAVFFVPLSYAVEEFPEVKDLMSDDEFRLTGMDKLNPEELQNLKVWLQIYTERDAEFLRSITDIASPLESEVTDVTGKQKVGVLALTTDIRSIIPGDFLGWTGNTKFVLANGQVWQQRGKARYRFKGIDPEVIIRKNILGFYVMEFPSVSRKVKVTRIQ